MHIIKPLSFFLAFWFIGSTPISDTDCSSCESQDHNYYCATNTIAMNNRLCMDLTEVPSMLWKTFLEEMKAEHGKNSEMYTSNIPDFSLWETVFPEMSASKISKVFMEEETFNLMPVIGVSYEQVLAFCKWREDFLKRELDAMSPKLRAKFPKKFEFRLPTNKEWARIRFMKQDKKALKEMDSKIQKNMKFFKVQRNKTLNNSERAEHIYQTNMDEIGLYNIFDNVAEMTSVKGVAMGGSWNELNEENNYDKEFSYEGAQSWLGFRCVFVIIE